MFGLCQIQNAVVFARQIQTRSLASFLSAGGNMASQKGDNKSPKKRTIEFDMFVRDLEPEDDEKIRGGGKTGDQQKPDDHKTERPH
jgi:hypothetical protein